MAVSGELSIKKRNDILKRSPAQVKCRIETTGKVSNVNVYFKNDFTSKIRHILVFTDIPLHSPIKA